MIASALEGRIDIRLGVAGGIVTDIAITNTRPLHAAAALHGKPVGQALAVLPLLFSLCGTAQALAGLAACEAALGIEISAMRARARRLALLAETVAEHAVRVLRDWPVFLNEAPDLAGARALRLPLAGLRPVLLGRSGGVPPDIDEAAVAAAAAQASQAVASLIFAAPPHSVLADPAAFTAWAEAGRTAPARLAGMVLRDGLADFTASTVRPLPATSAEAFEAILAADADGAYVHAPPFEGEAAEAGPLARRAGHPLIVALLARYGNGVLTRLAARLVDMQAALEEMTKQGSALPPPRAARPLASGTGSGTGLVEAARGLLVHRVEITEGVVRRWQILAPTEWNFHPHGPLARGLERAHVGNRAEALARLAVIALDPCVACEVRLR